MNQFSVPNGGQLFAETLPDDPEESIKLLIHLGLELEGALMEEFTTLEEQNGPLFQAIQDRKQRRYFRYDGAVAQFRHNIEKYKGASQKLIDELAAVQLRIKKQAQANMDVMQAITDNAQAIEMGIRPEDIEAYKAEQQAIQDAEEQNFESKKKT